MAKPPELLLQSPHEEAQPQMGWPLCCHEGHLPSHYQAPPLHMGEKHPPHCRWENGSMCVLPRETSFGHWNTSLLSQDENPIIGRIFAGNPNIQFFRCLPNRDVISSLNPPNSHDPNGGTYVRISGLLKEK